ncbi:MAG: 5-(carboxyamino)imidazole ribonucleotide synthase [Candidatus Dadabacteria bacterium]|nr:5-(carboxyamino)imidazole ribonucleotide synthase [Candidatus Dadabacteria bacterium]
MAKGIQTKLGILGGGQLGKMLCLAAGNWNLHTRVLDPSEDCPAAKFCAEFVQGDFSNYDDVMKFGGGLDVLTIEIEHVNTDALRELGKRGLSVCPSAEIISCIQDKGSQKQFLRDNQIPCAPAKGSLGTVFKSSAEIKAAVRSGDLSCPFVHKLCRGGYDGRGVFIVRSDSDLDGLLEGEAIVEEFIDIEKEISVIIARNAYDKTECFPPVEMVFNDRANLVEYVACPVRGVDPRALKEAEELAVRIAKLWNLRGIMAIEMFLTKSGDVLVNECAPRPHNSGHHTIEACETSQYEQCLRAVLGMPLGSTRRKTASVMVNILGEPGHEGEAVYDGLEECMKVKGAGFHIYGKRRTKPFRKMGHVTVTDEDLDEAFEKARFIKQTLKVVSL